MKDLLINTNSKESVIHCGEGAFEKFAPVLKDRQIYVVTDSNVYLYYRDLILDTFGKFTAMTILPGGEKCKTRRYLFEILEGMQKKGMTRSCIVVAIGGGVVGDIAGLAASLYMRGVKLVQIPTTVLAQVDSSVGGKTAIDFGGVKNLIGSFYQPDEVICDPCFLDTLPPREIRCGLGEIIKYGALDGGIYKKLIDASGRLTERHFIEDITYDCIAHKAKVVTGDERDLNGLRKTLNLGHTTGHAFELFYGKKSHGEFVLIGMYYEMYIAKSLGVGGGEYYDNLTSLIKSVIGKIPDYDEVEKAAANAKYDKKNASNAKISIIVPRREGESAELGLDMSEYIRLISECRDSIRKANGKS